MTNQQNLYLTAKFSIFLQTLLKKINKMYQLLQLAPQTDTFSIFSPQKKITCRPIICPSKFRPVGKYQFLSTWQITNKISFYHSPNRINTVSKIQNRSASEGDTSPSDTPCSSIIFRSILIPWLDKKLITQIQFQNFKIFQL